MMNYESLINNYIQTEIETLKRLDIASINEAINLLHTTLENGCNVYVFGNGGSASTASHFQNDFNKGISEHIDQKFHFICLNDNVPTIMAIANDIGYDEVFRFQLNGRIEPGDVCLAISGSGNSKNVINAVKYAKELGNKIIGLTGFDGGELNKLSDISLHIPINSMQITEDLHLMLDHLMMSVFYKTLCGIDHMK